MELINKAMRQIAGNKFIAAIEKELDKTDHTIVSLSNLESILILSLESGKIDCKAQIHHVNWFLTEVSNMLMKLKD